MHIKLNREDSDKPFEFKATNGRENHLHLDASKSIGGGEAHFSPMEAVAAAVAGCSSVDVVNILQKQKIVPKQYVVEVEAQRREEEPRIFTKIHLIFGFSEEVELGKAQRAVALSLEKYCSVSLMLEKTAKITFEVRTLSNQ